MGIAKEKDKVKYIYMLKLKYEMYKSYIHRSKVFLTEYYGMEVCKREQKNAKCICLRNLCLNYNLRT